MKTPVTSYSQTFQDAYTHVDLDNVTLCKTIKDTEPENVFLYRTVAKLPHCPQMPMNRIATMTLVECIKDQLPGTDVKSHAVTIKHSIRIKYNNTNTSSRPTNDSELTLCKPTLSLTAVGLLTCFVLLW